jgi:hypothetical protein
MGMAMDDLRDSEFVAAKKDENNDRSSAEPSLVRNDKKRVAMAVALMTLSTVNSLSQDPSANSGRVNTRKPFLERIVSEAQRKFTGSSSMHEPETLLAQGGNFENYARNFENYARNFENYARNFENYGRDFEHPSLKSRALRGSGQLVADRPSQLPNGAPVPGSIDAFLHTLSQSA